MTEKHAFEIGTGTLVLGLASNDGFIIAADGNITMDLMLDSGLSRLTFPSAPKIRMISACTAVTITGLSTIFLTPFMGGTEIDARAWYSQTKPDFGAIDLAEASVDPSETLSASVLDRVAKHVASEMHTFVRKHIGVLSKNAEVGTIVIVQYDSLNKMTRMAGTTIYTDGRGVIRSGPPHYMEISEGLKRDYSAFGEIDLLGHHVLTPGSVGHGYLGTNYAKWNTLPQIGDVSPELAVGVAREILQATERASQQIPSQSIIGGKSLIFHITGSGPAVQH